MFYSINNSLAYNVQALGIIVRGFIAPAYEEMYLCQAGACAIKLFFFACDSLDGIS
jgi:hypothetical protein